MELKTKDWCLGVRGRGNHVSIEKKETGSSFCRYIHTYIQFRYPPPTYYTLINKEMDMELAHTSSKHYSAYPRGGSACSPFPADSRGALQHCPVTHSPSPCHRPPTGLSFSWTIKEMSGSNQNRLCWGLGLSGPYVSHPTVLVPPHHSLEYFNIGCCYYLRKQSFYFWNCKLGVETESRKEIIF